MLCTPDQRALLCFLRSHLQHGVRLRPNFSLCTHNWVIPIPMWTPGTEHPTGRMCVPFFKYFGSSLTNFYGIFMGFSSNILSLVLNNVKIFPYGPLYNTSSHILYNNISGPKCSEHVVLNKNGATGGGAARCGEGNPPCSWKGGLSLVKRRVEFRANRTNEK